MVQWLGLSILTAKAQVQSLVGEGSQKKKKVWSLNHKHQHHPALLRNADSQVRLKTC